MMARKVGARIFASLDAARRAGLRVVERRDVNDGDDVYLITGSRYRLEVRVNPERWIGISFMLLDEVGDSCLTYEVDTDLYDILRPEQYEFAFEIEDEIVAFVEALVGGEIRVGELKGRPAMIVPNGDGVRRIWRGRFLWTSQHFSDLIQAQAGGKFERLDPS